MKTPLVTFKDVCYNIEKKEILSKVSFTLYEKDFITIVGPNGAGKSTLLKLLLDLNKATKGEIEWEAQPAVGFVPQSLRLSPYISLRVKDFLKLRAYGPDETENISKLVNQLNITDHLETQMHDLSGGELQKVMLIFALAHNPSLLILDEPLAGVDLKSQHAITQFLVELNKKKGVTVIMVSHDLNLVVAQSTYIICLDKHVCCSGASDIVKTSQAFKNLIEPEKADLTLFHHKDEEHS